MQSDAIRIVCLHALGTDAVREIGVRPISHIDLNGHPNTVVVADFLAMGTDREDTFL